MGAERAAELAEPGGGSPAPAAWRCGAGERCAVTWHPSAGVPEARRVRGSPEMGAWGGPGARAGPRPAADVQCSRTLEVGVDRGYPRRRRTPRGSEHFCAQRAAPPGTDRSASPGQRPVFQLRAALGGPPRREIVWPSLPSQVFTPDWSGRWEGRGWRPRGEPVVAARPARLGASGPAVPYGPPRWPPASARLAGAQCPPG